MNSFPSSLVLILALLKVSVKTNLVLHDSNHGILSNTIEGYSSNNVPDLHLDLPSPTGILLENDGGRDAHSLLKFEPAFLDFRERPLGIPYLQKVMLFNTDKNRSIDMKSISGSTVHFHSSFFEDKHIPPLGNTSFNVVFLGRDEGNVESDILIHTTKGHFKYKVKGASVSSSYRLRPIVGIKLPQNASFCPLIFIYNPHIEPIQVTEVYSTGDNFHLELPTGAAEGPKNMWEIPPLQTKAIIRVKFNSLTEQNHTAYIRFKLNNTEDVLAVPLEIEVTSGAGLYTSQGFLDFGVGGTFDALKSLSLYLQNPLKKAMKIDSIKCVSKSITIKHEAMKIGTEPGNDKGSKVATITLDWKSAYENNEFFGKIIVRYNNGKTELEIPYYASVIEGGLLFDPSAMTYFINEFPKNLKNKDLIVKNNYSQPLAITNVSLPQDAEKYFYMSNFKMVILKPQEETGIFTLHLKKGIQLQTLKLSSVIELHTNVTTVRVPLLSSNGKLHVEFPYKGKDGLMDLGLIGMDVRKEIYFAINNLNSAVIKIKQITTSLPLAEVQIVHCNKGNYTDVLKRNLSYNHIACDKLEVDEFAMLQLTLQSSYMEGQIWGTILIETQYENLTVPVHYKVAQGSLEVSPNELIFDQCFPGKVCSHPLYIYSTFDEPMIIEKIVSIPHDPRLTSELSGYIVPHSQSTMGHLLLNPALECLDECFAGLNFVDSVGWLHTLILPSITQQLDLRLVTTLYKRYLNETGNGLEKMQNLTLKLDTSEVKWHIFESSVNMIWPMLVLNNTSINFPPTQVGSISTLNITINNPSDHNLVVQLLLNPFYPDFRKLNDGLPPNFIQDQIHYRFASNAFFFNEILSTYRALFKKQTELDTHEATLPLLLPPGKNFTFSIGFDAEETGFSSGFLYIRNNLTVIEVLQLTGRGVIPNFKFGNRKLNSDIPLLFEFHEKQLKECEKKHSVLNFSVRRSFTARNLGEVPITIKGFYISDYLCEGYGFKVLNCESFVLLPNSSKKIDIAFMPDFTLTNLRRTLRIDTSLNQAVTYIMIARIPAANLIPCLSAIDRPIWEPYLYYISLTLMGILLILSLGMIATDAEHSLKTSMNALNRANATVHPPLDLRQVGAQTRLDIHSTKIAKEDLLDQNLTKPIMEDTSESNNDISNTSNAEPDKYSVLIPTTGKPKKKLKEDEIEDNQEKRKKSWLEAHKLKNKSTPKEVKKNVLVNSKECKKDKKHDIKRYEAEEEETYSISTDSSNTDEPEVLKIIGSKSRILQKNRIKLQKKSEEPQDAIFCKDSKKVLRKLCHKTKEKDKLENPDEELKELKHKVIKNNPSKEYIEKRNLKRKLSMEKKLSEKNVPAQVTPTPFTVWGDNKASFSDIVAKNDASPINFVQQILQPVCENEKLLNPIESFDTSTDLGPIGSGKSEHIKEKHTTDYSNSFFTNGLGSDSYSINWDSFVQPTRKDIPLQSSSSLVSDIWHSATTTNQQNGSALFPSTSNHESGNYLWGSSSVWKPWEPSEIQRKRTRTPPGFGNNSNSEVHENTQTNQKYDLFGMSNIWAKQYPNPWNSNSGPH